MSQTTSAATTSAATASEDGMLGQFEDVRRLLRTPSDNLSIFTKALALEGTVIDELLECNFVKKAIGSPIVPKDLKSKNRMQQVEFLLDKLSDCREVPIAYFLFFLAAHKDGIVNIMKEELLQQVEYVFQANWNNLERSLVSNVTGRNEEERRMDRDFVSLATSMECQRPIAILCVGKAGVGKSSLANFLRGLEATDESSAKTGRGGTTVTENVTEIVWHQGNVKVSFWDTPGLTHNEDDCKTFEYIKREVLKNNGKVDLVIFCAPAHETREYPEHRTIIENLTKVLGKDTWDNAVIVFTQANLVVDVDHEPTTAAYFHKHCVSEMTNRYRKILIETSGISAKKAEMVPCVPLGVKIKPCLPDGSNWITNFRIACVSRASRNIRGILTKSSFLHDDQAMRGIDKVRMMLGITSGTVGGAAIGLGAVEIGAEAGAAATAFAGPGAIVGATVGAVAGAGVGAVAYFAFRCYHRYHVERRLQEYEDLIGDHEDAQRA